MCIYVCGVGAPVCCCQLRIRFILVMWYLARVPTLKIAEHFRHCPNKWSSLIQQNKIWANFVRSVCFCFSLSVLRFFFFQVRQYELNKTEAFGGKKISPKFIKSGLAEITDNIRKLGEAISIFLFLSFFFSFCFCPSFFFILKIRFAPSLTRRFCPTSDDLFRRVDFFFFLMGVFY